MVSDFFENEKTKAEQEIGSRRAFGKLLPLLARHKWGLTWSLLLLSVGTALSLVWPVLLKQALDVDIKQNDFHGLVITVVLIGAIQLVTIVIQYVQRLKLEIIGQDVMLDLKTRLFDHILSLDVAYFDRNPVGRLLSRVESDTEALRMLFTNTAVLIVGDLILVVGIYAIMFYYSWRLAAILLLIIPTMAVLVIVFERLTTPRFFEVRKKMAEVTAQITEFLHGMSIIQIFHRGKYAIEKVNIANQLKFNEDAYVNIAVCIFFNIVWYMQYVMLAVVLYFGVLWIEKGVITVGTIGMFIILIWRIFEPIWRTSEQLSHIQKAIAGAKRIFALLSEQSSLPDPENPVRLGKIERMIRFEDVTFSYSGDGNHALRNVSFEIPVGKRVALVGVTGGGKTTVISLLLRLYDPQEGRITIDGVDIRSAAKSELRKKFALVLQDIVLFPGDVRSNISLEAQEITDERIADSAEIVQANRFVERLPQGYQTLVSEKGANFSRGERQLLSFARALVVDPEVLLLDEATSSVDPETERTIQASLKKLMEGRTSLIIAHRLSTILDVDEILVIRRGEIVERGTHSELILKGGYYSKLFHLQFKNANGVYTNVA
jgi:ATP-binding cassette subfamily B protein